MTALPEGLYLDAATGTIRDAQDEVWLTFVTPERVAARGDSAAWLDAVIATVCEALVDPCPYHAMDVRGGSNAGD